MARFFLWLQFGSHIFGIEIGRVPQGWHCLRHWRRRARAVCWEWHGTGGDGHQRDVLSLIVRSIGICFGSNANTGLVTPQAGRGVPSG